MKNLNSQGFTLIELIITIVILGLVTSIAGYSITNIIQKSKEKNLELLKDNIKHASELYYQECTYMKSDNQESEEYCKKENGNLTISLSNLAKYGFLTSNTEQNNYNVINPKNNKDISNCIITIIYTNGEVTNKFGKTNCP